MSKRTPLFAAHERHGAKLVDFAGWEMPLHYGSQLAEHYAVRDGAGMFDVSHMTIIDVHGEQRVNYLRRLLANDVAKLDATGAALYGLLLNESAGIVDDLIAYRGENHHRLVVNAGTREQVWQWLNAHLSDGVELLEQPLAMLAVQGPQAVETFVAVTGYEAPEQAFTARAHGEWLVARTGYTGEDGIEAMLPADVADGVWRSLAAAGVVPAGLGARDTLRLEAGLNLYGQDMDADTSPLVSNLGWTVAWDPAEREFIGRAALAAERAAGPTHKLTGVVLEAKGVMRHGQTIHTDAGMGSVTSGIFSPTLGYSIALARLPRGAKGDCEVQLRGKRLPARIVRPPFVRQGQRVYK